MSELYGEELEPKDKATILISDLAHHLTNEHAPCMSMSVGKAWTIVANRTNKKRNFEVGVVWHYAAGRYKPFHGRVFFDGLLVGEFDIKVKWFHEGKVAGLKQFIRSVERLLNAIRFEKQRIASAYAPALDIEGSMQEERLEHDDGNQ